MFPEESSTGSSRRTLHTSVTCAEAFLARKTGCGASPSVPQSWTDAEGRSDLPNDERQESLGWWPVAAFLLDVQGHALGLSGLVLQPDHSLALHFAVAIEGSGQGPSSEAEVGVGLGMLSSPS